MLVLLEEINACVENHTPHAALALALMVPDICSNIEFPDIPKEKGKRYKAWFNAHLKQFYHNNFRLRDFNLHLKEFTASACYELRCAFLHSGNSDLKNKIIAEFDFWIPDKNDPYMDCDVSSRTIDTNGKAIHKIRLNIPQFCTNVSNAAKQFYDEWDDKEVFKKYTINIFSVGH